MAQRPVVVAAVILGALVVGGCVYIQTPAGFQDVVLPLANAFAPGELEVERGRLGLGGSLEAEGVRYSAAELGVEASARELAVDLSIPSLLFGSLPHVNRLRLHDADVAVSPPPSEDEDSLETEKSLTARLRAVPVSIGEADIQGLNLELTHPTGGSVRVGPLELKISELLSGGTGRLVMSTAARVDDPSQEVDYSGNIELEAEVQQDDDARIESLRATARSNVRGAKEQQPTQFELDLAARFGGESEALSSSLDLRATRDGQPLGEATFEVSTSTDDDGNSTLRAAVALREITEPFLNPLIAPLGRGLVSQARVEGRLDVTASLPLDTSQLPRSASGELNVASFDYRTLAIADARASLQATQDTLLVELAPSRINRGSVAGKLSLDTGGEEHVVDTQLTTSALDLGALSKAFHEDVPNEIDGLLTLSASITSAAPPGVDLRETANGRVTTQLRSGRIKGFNPMAFLADQSGVDAFRAIPLDSFDVDANARVTDGVAYLHDAEVAAAGALLLINGSVALLGSLDLSVEAFVGPSLSGAFSRAGVEIPTLAAAERLVGVPVAIRVSGSLSSLNYAAAAPRTTDRAGAATGTGMKQLKDAADKVKLQDAADKVKGFFR